MFVTNSLTGGGAERAMNIAINELVRLGWPVKLVPINKGPEDFVLVECEVQDTDRLWKDGLRDTYNSYRKFKKIVSQWQPEIVIGTCNLPELYLGLLGNRVNSIVIVEEAREPWSNRPHLGRLIRRRLAKLGVNWIAASGHLRIWPTDLRPAVVIPNALTLFNRSPEVGKKNVRAKLVYVGRLSIEKRPDWFVEICAISGLSGTIIGAGIEEDALKEAARKTGAQVEFLGYLSNPWINLDTSNLVIVPSRSEGDGLVVIEALNARLPILLSDIPEFRFFGLPDHHYCLTPNEFASRILQFQNNFEELVVSQEIRDKILFDRDPSVIGKAWDSYLKDLIHASQR
jgi:glycosyltransferase involved in cell wall biosynthesis